MRAQDLGCIIQTFQTGLWRGHRQQHLQISQWVGVRLLCNFWWGMYNTRVFSKGREVGIKIAMAQYCSPRGSISSIQYSVTHIQKSWTLEICIYLNTAKHVAGCPYSLSSTLTGKPCKYSWRSLHFKWRPNGAASCLPPAAILISSTIHFTSPSSVIRSAVLPQ